MSTNSSSSSSQERLIPFPTPSRSTTGEPEPAARRRRDAQEFERPTTRRPRRARRRRHDTPWLQRNALSVAAASVLVALLGLGFGLLQMITRPEPGPALLALGQSEPTAITGNTLNASASGPGVQFGPVAGSGSGATGSLQSTATDRPREIRATAQVIDSNYTVAQGDTLGEIATRFNTTANRIQALNNLADPRALRIGTKLVIPPPL